MLKLPVLRWGQPYESLELDNVKHFVTGETLAQVGQANPGLLARDIKKHPERLQAVDARLLKRIDKLVAGVTVDLEAPLSPEDE